MRKYLLPNTGKFYKANLHTHSTISDGIWPPEKIKAKYMARGYSVIAYTDHNIMLDHSELTDETFLALNGYETSFDMKAYQAPRGSRRSCHICFIAPSQDAKMVCRPPEALMRVYSKDQSIEKALINKDDPEFELYYSPECINEVIRLSREAGFFVTYNHPTWSQENFESYSKYKGMHAMEIYNYGTWRLGMEGYCPTIYEDILKTGNYIYAIAADDMHTDADAFGGFTMIKSEKLDYPSIINALKGGCFYASMGPEIKELYYEDGKVHIKCSPARSISMSTGTTWSGIEISKNGIPVSEAAFTIHPLMKFVKITVVDDKGLVAVTNGYNTKTFTEDK